MHNNLLAEIRTARLHADTLPLWQRRHLVRRIFEQLADLRNAGCFGDNLRTNPHLDRLIRSGDTSVADLPKLSDGEFIRVLSEFELLLAAITDIIKTEHRAVMVN